MTINKLVRQRWVKWALGFAFWTLVGLSFAFQFYISSQKAGMGVTWGQAVGFALGDWYVFAVLSVPVIWLARRVQFESGTRAKALAAHFFCGIIFSLAYIVLRAWVGQWQSSASFADAFQPLLVKSWHFNMLVYWVIVSVTFAFDYYRKYQEREWRAAELEKNLAQAKLQALQMQLNPHFLFNSLHSISALMHQNVEAADRMIARLSDLLRAALAGSDTQEVTLREELEFTRRFLEIEQIRFGERLSVKMEIAPDTLDAMVPSLILQPLVENAIRHGIEPRARPGCIVVNAERANGELRLAVSDDGDGLPSGGQVEGVGLSNTRARLRTLYGGAHSIELRPAPGRGLQVRVTIPIRLRGDQPAPTQA
jgi:two-component system LytT family sensor kinase